MNGWGPYCSLSFFPSLTLKLFFGVGIGPISGHHCLYRLNDKKSNSRGVWDSESKINHTQKKRSNHNKKESSFTNSKQISIGLPLSKMQIIGLEFLGTRLVFSWWVQMDENKVNNRDNTKWDLRLCLVITQICILPLTVSFFVVWLSVLQSFIICGLELKR